MTEHMSIFALAKGTQYLMNSGPCLLFAEYHAGGVHIACGRVGEKSGRVISRAYCKMANHTEYFDTILTACLFDYVTIVEL